MTMRKSYDFSRAIKNPYAKRLERELVPSTITSTKAKLESKSKSRKKRKTVKPSNRASRGREYQR
jgi:hypothetical protein